MHFRKTVLARLAIIASFCIRKLKVLEYRKSLVGNTLVVSLKLAVVRKETTVLSVMRRTRLDHDNFIALQILSDFLFEDSPSYGGVNCCSSLSLRFPSVGRYLSMVVCLTRLVLKML